jgi:hypothetical protein
VFTRVCELTKGHKLRLKLDSGNGTSPRHSKISSIEIRLGEWERVFDQFNARFCITRNEYLDDIKSEKDVWIIEHPQPGQRAARDSLLFLPIHCLEWAAEIFSTACFHFYEYERVFVTTDNINFATAAPAKIA